jgi:hypothetical protein
MIRVLLLRLWQFYLDAEQPIEGPCITINKGTDAAKDAIYNLPDDHPEQIIQGHHYLPLLKANDPRSNWAEKLF